MQPTSFEFHFRYPLELPFFESLLCNGWLYLRDDTQLRGPFLAKISFFFPSFSPFQVISRGKKLHTSWPYTSWKDLAATHPWGIERKKGQPRKWKTRKELKTEVLQRNYNERIYDQRILQLPNTFWSATKTFIMGLAKDCSIKNKHHMYKNMNVLILFMAVQTLFYSLACSASSLFIIFCILASLCCVDSFALRKLQLLFSFVS